jgi:preprotein translocase subunit SecB
MQPVLLIQAPHMLFPFARRIIADVVRDGGMPPLMIEPIDFVALYQAKMGQAAVQPTMGNA